MQTNSIITLLESNIETPRELKQLPLGAFKYCTKAWAFRILKGFDNTQELIDRMCSGIDEPRISYIHYHLLKGDKFGHGAVHKDGYGKPSERHRLITFNGSPTVGEEGKILYANCLWEFSGDYGHQAKPTNVDCDRLLLRISCTTMPFRNRWEPNLLKH